MPLADRLLPPGPGHIDPPGPEPVFDVPVAVALEIFEGGEAMFHLDVIGGPDQPVDSYSVGRFLTQQEVRTLRLALHIIERSADASPPPTERRNDRLN